MNGHSKILKITFFTLVAFLPTWLQAQAISVAISAKEPTCFSWTDGEATATPSGGAAPYSYRWSNGQGGGQTVTGIPAGNYSVTVTDAANVEAIKSFTVGQPTLLVPAITVVGSSCDAGASYTGSGSGGIAPYTYAWRNLSTNQIINGETLTAPAIGAYQLSVTDSKGCMMPKEIDIKPLKVMVIAKPATCGGMCDGSAEAWVDGGTGPFTYRWSTGARTGIVFPLPGGSYSVTVTDALGCIKAATGTVFEPDVLKPNLTLTGQCSGAATATLAPTGGRAPLTVRWSTGATTTTVSNLTQGMYFVTVTDAVGCTKDTFFKVSTGILGLNITKTDANCSSLTSGTATMNVTGGAIGDYSYRWSNGATTATISNLNAGTYTATVTDGAGCTSSQSVTIQSVSNLVLQTAFTNSVCGGATGTAAVSSATGGTAPYSYRWSNGATTPSVSNLAAGQYTVTVTDASSCTKTASFVIQGQGNLNVILASSPSTCGSTTGMATVSNVSGGTAPFTYSWNNGATTQTISNVGVATYYVTVTDAVGCTASRVVEVQGTNAIQANITNTKAACGATNGTATITGVTGGTAPYTYQWSNGATTASVTGLAEGTYTVTITDASSCSKVTTVVINANSNLVLATATSPTVCGGATGSASVTSVTGGTQPYTYRWHNGGSTADITGLAAGPYFVTVTDAAGCTRVSTVEIASTADFTLATASTNSSCNGSTGTASVTVSGGNAPYIYKWSNGGTTQTISNIATGAYTVTVSDARNCTTVSAPVNVNPNSTIVAAPSVSNATCGKINGQITLGVTGGAPSYTYSWTDLTGTSQPKDRTNLSPGTYSVEVKDAAGCVALLSNLKIVDTGAVKALAALQPQGCTNNGDSVIIRLTNNSTAKSASITYSWLFTGNRTSTATNPEPLYGTTTGDARLIARSAEGCLDTLSLTFPVDVIKVALAPSPASTCLNTLVNIGATNQNPNFTPKYKWSNGDTTATTKTTPAVAGVTKLYVSITNSYGCTRKDSVTVNAVSNLTSADLTWKPTCEPFKILLFNTNPNADQWHWNFGDLGSTTAGSDALNPTYSYTRAGTFNVTLTPKSLLCLNSVTIPVTVTDKYAVTVNAGRDTAVCTSDRITLKATSSANNFEWSNTPTFTAILGSGSNLLVTPTTGSSNYYVRSKDTSSLGCIAVDTVVVANQSIKVDRANTVDICGNTDKTLIITNLKATDRLSVTWTPSSIIVGFANGDSLRPIIRATADATLIGTYKNQFGCTLTDNISIKTHLLKATVTATSKAIYLNETPTLTAGPTGTGYTYSWSSPSTVANPNAAITTVSPTDNTTYIVTVTDVSGCKDTAQVFLRVMVPQCEEPYIFIPRAFTPNGDGTNDLCYVRGDYLTTLEFVIFNRWGEQVFSTTDKSIGWDGKHNGQAVCPDVYGYYVRGTCQKGEQFFKKGNITVLK